MDHLAYSTSAKVVELKWSVRHTKSANRMPAIDFSETMEFCSVWRRGPQYIPHVGCRSQYADSTGC
ncbi:hypothetical protein M758_8G045900 [Ceratodon purpureus]|nr:hypothetical protein M758_8G045900 [Ceratodon purpureus]